MARKKKWYKENKVRVRELNSAWRNGHREAVRISNRKWKKNNPEIILKEGREWRKNNPDKLKASDHRRMARKAGNGGAFTSAEWNALCKRYKHKCLRCNKLRKLTADHVIPVSKGGTSNINNIQPLCGPCNSSKGTKSTDYRN